MNDASGFLVLPAIDLRGGRVVRLRQGDYQRETVYSDDPVAVARAFAIAGARMLHVVDLDAAKTGERVNAGAVEAIVAAAGVSVGVEVAGGIRDEATAATVLTQGAARVVIGTAALADPSFARRLVEAHDVDRVVAAIDVRDGRAVGHGWTRGADGHSAPEVIADLADAGVTTFEVTAIGRDGLLEGPDLALYADMVALAPGAIIASGGIATIDHVLAVRDVGCVGAILGRALYEGRIELEQVLRAVSPR